ncbi:MAG: sugar phosphate isomerase/epimerase [Oscillospiraceae bacterium]|nr:sugar phosphate isomerase/epimerase [Oscillospiraceae bacterium]
MKFAVTSYSFMQYIRAGKMTVVDCIAKAKEMGFDAIEFSSFPEDVDPIEFAKVLRAEADRVGIPICNFAVGADFINNDKATEIANVKTLIDAAEIMGCPTLRHDVTGGPRPRLWKGYDNVVEELADACRELTEYARAKGIKTMTENHGLFSQDSLRVEKLINTVANDNFGQLVDMGNFLCADDEPGVAVGRCVPYAFYVHAKDFIIKSGNDTDPGEGFAATRAGNYRRATIIGHGSVPVKKCLRALKGAGYDGYISVEFEGIEDCLEGVRIGLANLKRYVAEVYGE